MNHSLSSSSVISSLLTNLLMCTVHSEYHLFSSLCVITESLTSSMIEIISSRRWYTCKGTSRSSAWSHNFLETSNILLTLSRNFLKSGSPLLRKIFGVLLPVNARRSGILQTQRVTSSLDLTRFHLMHLQIHPYSSTWFVVRVQSKFKSLTCSKIRVFCALPVITKTESKDETVGVAQRDIERRKFPHHDKVGPIGGDPYPLLLTRILYPFP